MKTQELKKHGTEPSIRRSVEGGLPQGPAGASSNEGGPPPPFSHASGAANTTHEAKLWFPLFKFCILNAYGHLLLFPL